MPNAPQTLTSDNQYAPPAGLTQTQTSGGGTGYTDAGGNMYVQSSPGQYSLMPATPNPVSPVAPTTPSPQVTQGQPTAKTMTDPVTGKTFPMPTPPQATPAAQPTTPQAQPTAPTPTTPQASTPQQGTFYYTKSQGANGQPVVTYYDANGNVIPTNPIGGDQYALNPEGTPNAAGKLIQLPNAPTEGGFTQTSQSPEQLNSQIQGSTEQYQASLNNLNNQSDQAYNDYQAKLSELQNGTYPLSANQQEILNETKATFDQLRQQQVIANQTYQQGLQTYEARSGELSGGTTTAQGNLQNAINIGITKLSELDTKATTAIAQLEQGFQQDNIKLVTDAYDAFSKYATQKTNALKDIQDSTTQALKDLRDFTMKQTQQNIDNVIKEAQVQLDQGKFDWQKSQDLIKNTIDKANLGINERKQALTEAQFNLQKQIMEKLSSATPISILPSGQPDPLKQDQYLKQFPEIIQTKIKGISDYSIDPKSITTSAKQALGGFTQSDLIAAAKIYDPTYDEKEYAARQKFLNNWKAGGQNSVIVAANTAVQHLAELKSQGDLLQNIDAGNLGPFTTKYNSISQWLSESSGNPQATQYKQTAIALAGELSKIYKNSINSSAAPTDDEIKQQLETLTTDLSPQQLNAVIGNGAKLMTDRLIAAQENYQINMGKPPANILQPTTIERLNELNSKGINIDMSKLNTTAYSGVSNDDLINSLNGNSGGSGQSTVDPSQFFNLFNAVGNSINQ